MNHQHAMLTSERVREGRRVTSRIARTATVLIGSFGPLSTDCRKRTIQQRLRVDGAALRGNRNRSVPHSASGRGGGTRWSTTTINRHGSTVIFLSNLFHQHKVYRDLKIHSRNGCAGGGLSPRLSVPVHKHDSSLCMAPSQWCS